MYRILFEYLTYLPNLSPLAQTKPQPEAIKRGLIRSWNVPSNWAKSGHFVVDIIADMTTDLKTHLILYSQSGMCVHDSWLMTYLESFTRYHEIMNHIQGTDRSNTSSKRTTEKMRNSGPSRTRTKTDPLPWYELLLMQQSWIRN